MFAAKHPPNGDSTRETRTCRHDLPRNAQQHKHARAPQHLCTPTRVPLYLPALVSRQAFARREEGVVRLPLVTRSLAT